MPDEHINSDSRFASPDGLLPSLSDPISSSGSDWTFANESSQPWRRELARWLASLNPGRTQREYEKAVGYFFDTPGVPQHLSDVTFDLLLAYRGALALRATPHEQRHFAPAPSVGGPRLSPPSLGALEGETPGAPAGDSDTTSPLPPLAPATVNVRLTALRQFLVHCFLSGSLPQLTPDRIRAALRRLSIERRRPYQVLGEQEWDQFLRAANYPRTTMATASNAANRRDSDTPGEHSAEAPVSPVAPILPKSRAGLTGVRTAERDHALIALALATGLRAIELAGLDLGDLSREWTNGKEEWWLQLPDAKTKGQRGGRTLPLAPSLVETLLAYVQASGRRWDVARDRATPLFLSQTRRRALRESGPYLRLSAAHIRSIVDRVETQWLALRSEIDAGASRVTFGGETRQISPHALRHSTAIALLEGSVSAGRPPASVEHVRGWLGHFDIRTTQGYLAHLDARRHRRPFALAPGAQAKPNTAPTPTTEPIPSLDRSAERQSES